VAEAAKLMRDRGIGDVLVEADGRLYGLVTDRDIVVRVLAAGGDPRTTLLADIHRRLGPDPTVGALGR
jgi:CBS domain-containing protein